MLAASTGSSRAPAVVSPSANGHAQPRPWSGRPEILSLTFRPIDYLNALRRRWVWALVLGIVCAGLAVGAGWLLIPVNYTASATLRVTTNRPVVMFDKSVQADSLLDHRRAQASLIKSNRVVMAALARPGISQLPYVRREMDAPTWLKDKIVVSFPDNSQLLQIAITGEDPQQALKLVEAVANAYKERIVDFDQESFDARVETLRARYRENLALLEGKERSLAATDSDTARAREIRAIDTLADLRAKVQGLRSEASGLDRRIALMTLQLEAFSGKATQGDGSLIPDPAEAQRALGDQLLEAALAQDPGIQHIQAEISRSTAAIVEEKLRARSEDAPSVERLEERKESLDAALAARREELAPQYRRSIEEQINQGLAQRPLNFQERVRQEIEALKINKAVLEDEGKLAQAAFDEAAQAAAKTGQDSIQFASQQSDLNRLRKLTDRMAAELAELEIEEDAAPRITFFDTPSVPLTSDIDKKTRMMGLLGLAGFFAAVVGVAGVDLLARRINSPLEITYGLGLTVMGDVPLVMGRLPSRHGALPRGGGSLAQAMLTESIDSLRTTVLHRAATEGAKVILVTSPMAQEGKTTVSTQLAASLARSGRRTLLIDGDVRRPTCHALFDVPREPGVSELLRGEAELDDAARPTRVAGLWIIPAGRLDTDAIQALARGELEQAFETIRQDYDLAIIDTGPVLSDSNCLLFGRHSDGVILSVLRDVTRTSRVFEACERIRGVDLRLLGAVVNGVSASRYRSYYGYAYRPDGPGDREE